MKPDSTSNEESSEKSTDKNIIDKETSLNKETKAETGTEIMETDKLQCLTFDGDEDDDDVPGDFFDDFLKDDFMAALDVIDDDDDDGIFTTDGINLSYSDTEIPCKKSQSDEKKERVVSTTKEFEEKDKSTNSNPQQKKSNDIGIYRDPKKTKRDIELDKARCEKNRELKRITEKLKLVETGMVPPGMEMETDIDEIEKQKALENMDIDSFIRLTLKKKSSSAKRGMPKGSSRYRSKSPKTSNRTISSSRSPMGTSKRLTHKPRSPLRSIHNPTRDRPKSPLNTQDRRSSPLKSRNRRDFPQKSRNRHDSPQKSRDRHESPLRSQDWRESPLRSQNRGRSPREARDRWQSPINLRDRRESPKRLHRLTSPLRRSRDRRDSSRERRISRNHNSRRSQERSRSHSHDRRRRRSRSLKRKRDEKKSFLQEIAEKLRNPGPFESHPTSASAYHIDPQVAPPLSVPTPVPAPLLSTQYPLQPQNYNRNFFIGTPQTNILPSQPAHYQVGLHGQMQTQMHQQTVHQQEFSTPMPFNFSHSQIQNNLGHQTLVEPQSGFKANDNIYKYNNNKKITLTDFFTITANPEVYLSSSEQMKHKIDVITRCQHAITYLENTKKRFTGPLILHKDDDTSKSPEEKFKSPLLKTSDIKLRFTEIPNTTKHKLKLSAYINNLLQNQGLLKDVVVIDDEPEVNSEIPKAPSVPPTTPIISLIDDETDKTGKSATDGEKLSDQTDTPRCLDCEKRSKIVTKSIGVQCGNDITKFSVGTQVREEAFYHAFPKNQSLASLTPAQLLAGSVAGPSKIHDVDDYNMIPRKKSRPFDYPNHMNSPQQAPPAPRGIFGRPTGSMPINKYNYF